jgi:toxin ParE1/3/4
VAELNWTAEAQRWLQEIYQYIAQNDPSAAASVVDGIFQRAQILGKH